MRFSAMRHLHFVRLERAPLSDEHDRLTVVFEERLAGQIQCIFDRRARHAHLRRQAGAQLADCVPVTSKLTSNVRVGSFHAHTSRRLAPATFLMVAGSVLPCTA